ncbi:MAG: hypothetical protein ABI723_16445 [Bacteroidia bacterium]
MKKIILAFFLILSIIANAQQQKQEPQQPTTEEEYNFGFTGYKLQLQMKLPMKKGYTITDLETVERGERKCVFKSLFRDKEKQPCALIMIYDRPRVNPEYFCIPSSDAPADLWDKFFSSLKSDVENEQERFKFFTYAIATALMKK